jgi:hypothetical protein
MAVQTIAESIEWNTANNATDLIGNNFEEACALGVAKDPALAAAIVETYLRVRAFDPVENHPAFGVGCAMVGC